MFHNALLHPMRVAATKQTTFTISLKRSAPAFAAGHASQPNTPSDAISMTCPIVRQTVQKPYASCFRLASAAKETLKVIR
jgi:hypothetical protein